MMPKLSDQDYWYLRYTNVPPPEQPQLWASGLVSTLAFGEDQPTAVRSCAYDEEKRVLFFVLSREPNTLYTVDPLAPGISLEKRPPFIGANIVAICCSAGNIYMLDAGKNCIIELQLRRERLHTAKSRAFSIVKLPDDEPLTSMRLAVWQSEAGKEGEFFALLWRPDTPGCWRLQPSKRDSFVIERVSIGLAEHMESKFRPWQIICHESTRQLLASDSAGLRLIRRPLDSAWSSPHQDKPAKVFAGDGVIGNTSGPGTRARFTRPQGLAIFNLGQPELREHISRVFPRHREAVQRNRFLVCADSAGARLVTIDLVGEEHSTQTLFPINRQSQHDHAAGDLRWPRHGLSFPGVLKEGLPPFSEVIAGPHASLIVGTYNSIGARWFVINPRIGEARGTAVSSTAAKHPVFDYS